MKGQQDDAEIGRPRQRRVQRARLGGAAAKQRGAARQQPDQEQRQPEGAERPRFDEDLQPVVVRGVDERIGEDLLRKLESRIQVLERSHARSGRKDRLRHRDRAFGDDRARIVRHAFVETIGQAQEPGIRGETERRNERQPDGEQALPAPAVALVAEQQRGDHRQPGEAEQRAGAGAREDQRDEQQKDQRQTGGRKRDAGRGEIVDFVRLQEAEHEVADERRGQQDRNIQQRGKMVAVGEEPDGFGRIGEVIESQRARRAAGELGEAEKNADSGKNEQGEQNDALLRRAQLPHADEYCDRRNERQDGAGGGRRREAHGLQPTGSPVAPETSRRQTAVGSVCHNAEGAGRVCISGTANANPASAHSRPVMSASLRSSPRDTHPRMSGSAHSCAMTSPGDPARVPPPNASAHNKHRTLATVML